MRYNKTVEARFIVQVEVAGKMETVHVKNTGCCKELLIPDSRVILSETENPARKTRHDLIAVENFFVYRELLHLRNADKNILPLAKSEHLRYNRRYGFLV